MVKKKVIEALAIVLVSALLALSTNSLRSDGLPLIREKSAAPAGSETAMTTISLEAFLEASRIPGTVILDVRPEEDFLEAHIPRAQSLPSESSEEQTVLVLRDVGYDREIVVYCSGVDCEAAEEVAASLRDRGYFAVRVFSGGWEEWISKNLPVEAGAQ